MVSDISPSFPGLLPRHSGSHACPYHMESYVVMLVGGTDGTSRLGLGATLTTSYQEIVMLRNLKSGCRMDKLGKGLKKDWYRERFMRATREEMEEKNK